ncbi:4Fe-4S dicluster domain-containing protein [Nitratireductor sp. XY-223]|uniref:4Fe-4S dicluster domain-containing protein n=1 Tax=Nitratireductor sp. XY-223 TaxID=2561926 RepID=UPI0010AA5211|nr:4Fe-4S dicluster domain-containing protein [Nitratireductor sp. XY-223]
MRDGDLYNRLDTALKRHGLMARGGLHLTEDADLAAREYGFTTVVLAGHAGSSFWPDFETFRSGYDGTHPLDAWSRSVGSEIESEFGCKALYPFEKPWWPFQSWIKRTEGLEPSPLAILIHPEFGLWHGYRAAFAFAGEIAVPAPVSLAHACDSCAEKPCISTCPAEAVAAHDFAIKACRTHLDSNAGRSGCMVSGCLARNACPVGRQYQYVEAQLRFHMDALEPLVNR